MGSRIEKLKEKYWSGKTSLNEEMELKEHFEQNPSLQNDEAYFRLLKKKSNKESLKDFKHPESRKKIPSWFSAAASLIVGIGIAIAVFLDAQKQKEYIIEDPQEAYEITRKALLMVSSGLNKGTEYSSELQKINKAEEIIKEEEL
jgi:hypothetical protein